MSKFVKTRVLIAPLDWGLGHATRCIPIIHELLKAGFEVIVAAEGRIRTVLEKEFPLLTFVSLRGYNIRYARTSPGLLLKIFSQIPKILSVIRFEHKWLDRIIDEQKIDLIISDNRYGLYSHRVQSIFITHQLCIQTPFARRFLQQLNYKHIKHFNVCWIPDSNKGKGFAGLLSHPKKLPQIPVKYIGILSRFQRAAYFEDEKHLLLLLSGSEPQRTILEKKLLRQVQEYKGSVVLVRGLPGINDDLGSLPKNVTVFSHAETAALEQLISQASFVIARSGYSTVMDLVRMQKKSILIPTPGQTEQEYLAKYLNENKIAFTQSQKEFELVKALALAQSFNYKIPEETEKELLTQAIYEVSTVVNK